MVFGDIGTSPLYALKQTLAVSGSSREAVLGVVSLIFWALMLVVSVKYLRFVMRADNHGEGGILALLALLPEKVRLATGGRRLALLILILIGTALLFGDGALTPAISVLSATEGLALVNPSLEHWAVPLTVVILAVLFAVQSRGTHQIGRVFGPVMVLWFVVIAGLGIWHIIGDPSVITALSPTYGIAYLVANPGLGFAIGAVVILAVTGAEALYADMGHFGIRPIRLAWAFLIAPSLVLCYLGQAAVVIKDPSAAADPFFSLAPHPTFALLMVILSTAATVIASQALITGVFSLSRQAVQLGLLPRLTIRHTSSDHEGQIYVPIANWLLSIASIALVIAFGSSTSLASAYVLANSRHDDRHHHRLPSCCSRRLGLVGTPGGAPHHRIPHSGHGVSALDHHEDFRRWVGARCPSRAHAHHHARLAQWPTDPRRPCSAQCAQLG